MPTVGGIGQSSFAWKAGGSNYFNAWPRSPVSMSASELKCESATMGCCMVTRILRFPADVPFNLSNEPIDLQSQDHSRHGRLTSPDSLANDVQLHRCNTASHVHLFFAFAPRPRLKGLVLVLTSRKFCFGDAVLQKVWIARQDQSLTIYHGMLLAL